MHPCIFCGAADADADLYNERHPAPQPHDGRATYLLDWEGRPYVTHAAGQQTYKENPS